VSVTDKQNIASCICIVYNDVKICILINIFADFLKKGYV
jgi:hypothetical protein